MSKYIGRNSACPCGSGKRYKQCHGAPGAVTSYPVDSVSNNTEKFQHALILHQSARIDEAEAIYRSLMEADVCDPQVWHYYGVIRYQKKDYETAERYIRLAISIVDDMPMAYNNLGLVLKEMGRYQEVISCYEKALQQDPNNANVYNNYALVLCEMGRYAESIKNCERAISLRGDMFEAKFNLGRALYMCGAYDKSQLCFKELLEHFPRLPDAGGYWLSSKIHCCDWNGLENAISGVLEAVSRGERVTGPFVILATSAGPELQRRCARILVNEKYPYIGAQHHNRNINTGNRVRVAYLSADFHNHATAHLISELFEVHDRTLFEIFGISFGPVSQDVWRRRIERGVDHFVDVNGWGDKDITDLLSNLKIDIAVDLKGHTRDSRTAVFSYHSVPIQVNYLGYPGTMGAGYYDYIIADHVIIPDQDVSCYDEKVVFMPHTYQVNCSSKVVANTVLKRSDLGLPSDGFVFCCFNNSYKISPDVFDIWMRLLRTVDRSVLWLFEGNLEAVNNLKIEARRRGVEPDRLVFAPRMELPDHLARLKHADLFLDTFYYNAHTTASDALWVGVPVLTCKGNSFPGRVAASLLKSLDFPELIAEDRDEYESIAYRIATNAKFLMSLRLKLERNVKSKPTFNTPLFARHIETAFSAMMQRYRSGLPPANIEIVP